MLPSKKIQIALAILIIGIGALIFSSYKKNSKITYSSTPNNLDVIMSSSTFTGNYAQTNSNSIDSKGGNGESVAPEENLTATDIFARDFLTKVVKISQSSSTLSTDSADQYVSEYLKTAPLPEIDTKKYSFKDLSITNSTNLDMRTYQTQITAVFSKNWPVGAKQNEMIILAESFSNNNPAALSGLTKVISIYESALKGSLAIKVPQKAAADHLAVVNALSAYIQTLKMIQSAYTDSISGVVGLESFITNRENLTDSMKTLRMLLINTIV